MGPTLAAAAARAPAATQPAIPSDDVMEGYEDASPPRQNPVRQRKRKFMDVGEWVGADDADFEDAEWGTTTNVGAANVGVNVGSVGAAQGGVGVSPESEGGVLAGTVVPSSQVVVGANGTKRLMPMLGGPKQELLRRCALCRCVAVELNHPPRFSAPCMCFHSLFTAEPVQQSTAGHHHESVSQ